MTSQKVTDELQSRRGPRPHWAAGLVSIVVGLPLFVSVGADGISAPTGPSIADRGSTVGVPLSLFILVVAIAATCRHLHRSRQNPLPSLALAAFVVVNVAALTYGSLTGRVTAGSFAFFLQTMIPLLGYVFGTQLFVDRSGSLSKTYTRLFVVPLLALVAIGLTTLVGGGQPWIALGDRIGPIDIPQIRRFVPTVFAVAIVGLVHREFRRRQPNAKNMALIGVSLVLITAVHSRTALLIVVAGGLVTIAADPARRKVGKHQDKSTRKRAGLIGGMTLAVILAIGVVAQLPNGPVGLTRLIGNDEQAQLSSSRRYDALTSSISESFQSPFGRAYAANENTSLDGEESAISRVSNSENQLGEFGLRAGPLAIVSILVFLMSLFRDAHKSLRKRNELDDDALFMAAVWIATVAGLTASILTQQSLSQPFSGLFLWLMLGLLRGWTVAQKSDDEPADEPRGQRVATLTP